MGDQTQASLAEAQKIGDIAISAKDRGVLVTLAERVAACAADPINDVKRDLWYRHNALEPTRPVIFCDPENGWGEIITERDLACEGDLARTWEMTLQKELFWGESMGDDRVVTGIFDVPHVYEESDWGMHETIMGGQDGGSYVWDPPLKNWDEDFGRLRFPYITVDHEATDRLYSLANDLFNGALDVRVGNPWWWTLGMTWTLVNLRGLMRIMYDCFDYPVELKRLMAFLRDGTLAKLDYLERDGLLRLNNDGTYVGSGGFGWTRELPAAGGRKGCVRTADMWGFCESQETSTWSPEMFGEFIFPYQLPILERFGLNCYGCCEPLDKRWDIVRRIPRLRRVSVSPWADAAVMAEMLGSEYIYSLKPIPTDIAVGIIDEGRIRKNLRRVIGTCRGTRLEIVMKDNHTIGKNPDNVIRWCAIAREEAEAFRP